MKLEVGKKYKCRNIPEIEYVEITRCDPVAFFPFSFACKVIYNNGMCECEWVYADDGYLFSHKTESSYDLISEYVENSENNNSSEKTCECGAQSCGYHNHSDWCPMYEE